MDLGIEGKVALVAASSRGLGRAVAEELAAEGARLAICARGAEALEETRAALASSGAEVFARPFDLADAEALDAFVSEVRSELGAIDILVTNGGGPPAGTFNDFTAADWSRAVALTLDSVVNLTRAVLPDMRRRGWGRILNVTSIAVKQPVDGLMLSNSVRAAVTGFARTLANEVAAEGITVNNILPGYTWTDRVEQLAHSAAASSDRTRDEVVAAWEAAIPMRRLGNVREFAALAAFLVSARASYITGTSIPVDGGWIRALL